MKIRRHNRYEYSPIIERKPFEWPNGKRLAFYVALNVEDFSFGEGLGHTPTTLGPLQIHAILLGATTVFEWAFGEFSVSWTDSNFHCAIC